MIKKDWEADFFEQEDDFEEDEIFETSCDDVVFIKNENLVWKVFSSDGTQLAATDSRAFAFILARQYNLTPQSVH